jgi:hypothetical protein
MEVLDNNTVCKDCQMQTNIQKRLMGTKGNQIYNNQNGEKKGEGKEQPKLSAQVVMAIKGHIQYNKGFKHEKMVQIMIIK